MQINSIALAAAGMLASLAPTAWAAPLAGNVWSVGSAAPIVAGTSVEFVVGDTGTAVWANGQTRSKDFYSTAAFNGQAMSTLAGATLSYTITAPAALVSPPNNGLAGPYVNIVVTDGTGGFTYLLMDASAAPAGQQSHAFSTARYAFNENSGASMAAFVAGLGIDDTHDGKDWYDFSDISGLVIASAGLSSNAGGVAPVGGWVGFGTTDSMLLVSGNRGSTPTPDVTIDGIQLNLQSVPEPMSLGLVALALAGIGLSAPARRRRGA